MRGAIGRVCVLLLFGYLVLEKKEKGLGEEGEGRGLGFDGLLFLLSIHPYSLGNGGAFRARSFVIKFVLLGSIEPSTLIQNGLVFLFSLIYSSRMYSQDFVQTCNFFR